MKVKWLAHACFLITSDSGVRIITDPYELTNALTYAPVKETADIVTVSHDHFDHNNAKAVRGNPIIVRKTTEVKGITFRGIPSHHDTTGGKERGNNTIFCFEVDSIKACHVGDLGHRLDDQQVKEVGPVDVLFLPVGGFYTIDAKVATQVVDQLQPKVAIPMHFKVERCGLPITGVAEFLKGKKNVTQLETSETEFKVGKLPNATQIIVLQPAN
ncbi:MAG: MBL fold metallo-hydrolase [Chloroflexi bacterium]|nr:MBL fold metallo-hydrolase [Chloroflexota bacterium]